MQKSDIYGEKIHSIYALKMKIGIQVNCRFTDILLKILDFFSVYSFGSFRLLFQKLFFGVLRYQVIVCK